MYRPTSTRDIYMGSLSVNSANLEKQFAERSVPGSEIRRFVDILANMYIEDVDAIVKECDTDMMALERMPSPLKLFIDCLSRAQKSTDLSPPARALAQQYTSAWEDWM
jgi:hypothetical protein